MPVYTSIGFAILFWSLYPLAASYGLEDMNNWDVILSILVIAAICATIFTTLHLSRKKLISKAIQIHKNLPREAYVMALVSSVSTVLVHTFFLWALYLAHKGGVTLLFESWPIIAVIATPFLMKRSWSSVSGKEIIVSCIALIGVGIIVFTDKSIDFNFNQKDLSSFVDYTILGGYIMALLGAYMSAISIVSQAALAEYFQELGDDFSASITTQISVRILSVILAFLLLIFLRDFNEPFVISWGPVIFIGFFTLTLGASLYSYTLLKTSSPTIHILYYFVPVLAIIWMWLAGQTTLTIGLGIGGAIITACNIYLAWTARRKSLERAP